MPLLLQRLARRVEAIATTDLLSGPAQYFQQDVPTLLVSFGRSGSSPESVAVVDLADRLLRRCHHIVFTCNEQGTLYQHCRERRNSLAILLPPETHDQSFAMTSSFTAMMLAASLVFNIAEIEVAGVANIARATRSSSSGTMTSCATWPPRATRGWCTREATASSRWRAKPH